MNKNGFTLVEILTAVVIVGILVAMAMPLYEKTIERSRLTEARSVLNRMQSAKRHAMDNMGCLAYDSEEGNCPKLQHLNIQFKFKEGQSVRGTKVSSDAFCYSIAPGGSYPDGVCAKRLGGEYAGTVFVYNGELDSQDESIADNKFLCSGSYCEQYGMNNTTGLSCDCN